ncbi:unnamed protein product [Toxocara canis]|uniref:Uncharacterized protein n=1 Tax=Toxocara canis TaxID=6265 RepID=A0A183UIC9_TOXCA|nr:unnamed protein product [Toxocara canis]
MFLHQHFRVSQEANEAPDEKNDSSFLKIPLKRCEQNEKMNAVRSLPSSPSNIPILSDFVTKRDAAQQQYKDHIVENIDLEVSEQNVTATSYRVEQWVNETIRRNAHQKAVLSPAENDLTPLRGGGLLPVNFISNSAKPSQRKRIPMASTNDAHKLSFSKLTNSSPTNVQNIAQTRTPTADTAKGFLFVAEKSSRIISPQQSKMNDGDIKFNVAHNAPVEKILRKPQESENEYVNFITQLPMTSSSVASPRMITEKRCERGANAHTSPYDSKLLPSSLRGRVQHNANRGVTFGNHTPRIPPIPDAGDRIRSPVSREAKYLPLETGLGILKKETNKNNGRHQRNRKPKQRDEQPLFTEAYAARRRHRSHNHAARAENALRWTSRSTIRKPGRRTEERILTWFEKMSLDKQQEIIAKCSAKR